MKNWIFGAICLFAMTACSTSDFEEGNTTPALGALKVYDLKKSDCKISLSKTETIPEIYDEYMAKNMTLEVNLDKDGEAKCVVRDIIENCAVEGFKVDAKGSGSNITLVIYPTGDPNLAADCQCDYDVDFKLNKLSAGKYGLTVYRADYSGDYSNISPIFKGELSLEVNHPTTVALTK